MSIGPGLRHCRLRFPSSKQALSFRCESLWQRNYHYHTRWNTSSGKRGIAGGSDLPTLPSPNNKRHSEPSYLRDVPLSSLLNSLLVLSVAALPPGLLSVVIRWTKKHAYVLENNGPLRWLFKKTFYDHFCIGEEGREITKNITRLRQMGMTGVVLGFAREAQENSEPPSELTKDDPQLREWTEMNKETINKLEPGDFVGIRCTGAGSASINCMSRFSAICKNESEGAAVRTIGHQLDVFHDSMHQICDLAVSRDVRVLIDAESSQTQRAIDHVALKLMAKFNALQRANIFNTYQMYFKSTLQRITSHLNHAVENNYISGVKMVRGAFIHTEPERDLIHSSKKETDDAYDTAVAYLLGGQADGPQQVNRAFHTIESSLSTRMTPWRAELVLATHNSESVRKALSQYLQDHSSFAHPVSGIHRVGAGFGVQGIFFAQLMGMADEVSLKLATQIRKVSEGRTTDRIPKIGVYKYSVWGSMGECLLYLLRRAEENQDAVKRSRETALAIWRELFRRMLFFP